MTLHSYRVLIVDDNLTFAKTLSMLVKSILGNRLSELVLATNGQEAVNKAFNQNGFDVIFMDVNMPQMNGVTATQLINRSMYRQTRIIAVSFQKDMKTLTQMIQAGAENFIFKDNLTVESIEKVFS
ncbi:MAG TPA: response regulator [Tenuifilaceae bacterium]|nr:response regulator [Tenuifilaceae bacterium]